MTTASSTENAYPKGKQGFASMSPAKRREIASVGGRAAHKKGTAHKWTSAEAKLAGMKGGAAKRDKHAAQDA